MNDVDGDVDGGGRSPPWGSDLVFIQRTLSMASMFLCFYESIYLCKVYQKKPMVVVNIHVIRRFIYNHLGG